MSDLITELYPFIYRGILTQASLQKSALNSQKTDSQRQHDLIREKLSFDMLDVELVNSAKKMAIVYTGIHTFENMVRDFVKSVMQEKYSENWWEKVPTKIQKKVETRKNEDSKFKWHGSRGATELEYCDFGDLQSIITTNWEYFEITLQNMEWMKSILTTLERSRNIIMHGGKLSIQDIERIGINVKDWVRQVG